MACHRQLLNGVCIVLNSEYYRLILIRIKIRSDIMAKFNCEMRKKPTITTASRLQIAVRLRMLRNLTAKHRPLK